MGFGSAFKSAWNNATDSAKQKVARVATGAKQVGVAATKKIQAVKTKSVTAAKWAVSTTAKIAETAQKSVKKVKSTTSKQVAKAVKTAKGNIKRAYDKAKTTANTAKATTIKKAKLTSRKVNNTFNKIKKNFSPVKQVKRAILNCPPVKFFKSNASPVSKSASLLSFGINAYTNYTNIETLKDAWKLSKAMRDAGRKAVRFGSDTKGVAMGKHLLRHGKNTPLTKVVKGVALDIALGGLTGGLDAFAKNVDRKDISRANKAGRVGFGVAQGAATSGVSAVMGAAVGATIGLVLAGPGGGVAGAKLGAMFLSPLFEKPAEWVTNKAFTEAGENKAGQLGDKVSSSVKGAWLGAANIFR